MLLVIVVAVLVVALFFLGRWLLARIDDYPATMFGPLDPPPHSS